MDDLQNTSEKQKDEMIIGFTTFFDNVKDAGHIRTREAFNKHLDKLYPLNTPKLNLEKHFSPSDRPLGATLFLTVDQDIPPEAKSDSEPVATNTGAIKNTTASTGAGSSDPPKEPST